MATRPSITPSRALRGALITLSTALLVACGGQSAQRSSTEQDAAPRSSEEIAISGKRSDAGDTAVTDTAQSLPSVTAKEEPLPAAAPAEAGRNFEALMSGNAQTLYQAQGSFVQRIAPQWQEPVDRENYAHVAQNGVKVTRVEPVSTFSVDVDTAAYSNMRRFLSSGQLPRPDAVRVEELINYFSYEYAPPPRDDQPFSVVTEVAPTPWNPQTLLMQIGVKGYEVPAQSRPASNLTFLIDVSGSMHNADKLPLLKTAFRLLTNNLDARDSVAIVVYAGASGLVLEPTAGDNGAAILAALEQLRAGGSTNGASGIRLAYDVARSAYIDGGINRVILATDGDFNVGTVNFEALLAMIERERQSGVSLTTLGFGRGNLNDRLMEQLADTGNGNYAYIDNINEARKVLVDEMGATLQTIAKDVKIQVEFNPARVAEYRLIGYENRALNRDDFNNDKVDAGEIGAGHTVTAIYELTPVGSPARLTDPLRYGAKDDAVVTSSDELAFVRLRYKAPAGSESALLEFPVGHGNVIEPQETSDDFRFAAAVAAFGQQLRGGRFTDDYALDETMALASGALGQDRHGYRREFVSLISTAQALQPTAGVRISDRGADDR